ncbi:hypothetical protein FJY63_03300 [Candidatus Sumerlaeota bacterium]|nr:hypothetical protein [Candidatus Sumerlaeota bacterium]
MTEEQLEAERQIALVREKKAEEQKVAAPQAPEEPAESDEAVEETASSNSGAAADEAEPDRAVSRQPVRVQYTVDDFGSTGNGEGQLSDELYDRALRLILESKKASVSLIQRRMKIGFARAGRLMDLMEDRGIVGPYQGSKPRQLRVDPIEYLRKLDSKKR